MNSTTTSWRDDLIKKIGLINDDLGSLVLKLPEKDKRKLLKTFLLCCLHQLFADLFKNKFTSDPTMECYEMDKKIIQILIHDIIETGEYTLVHCKVSY